MPNYYLEQLGSEQPEESYNQEINNSSGYIQQPNQQQPQKGWKLESLGNDQPQEESFLGDVGRKAAIMSKGVTQRVLGAPADIAEVPRSILGKRVLLRIWKRATLKMPSSGGILWERFHKCVDQLHI